VEAKAETAKETTILTIEWRMFSFPAQFLDHDGIRLNCNRDEGALPLPLAGEGWGGGN